MTRVSALGAAANGALGAAAIGALSAALYAQSAAPRPAPLPTAAAPPPASAAAQATLQQYCVTCHNDRLKTADLSL